MPLESTTPPHRLLVVDDKENMRQLLETAFVERGFEVSAAASGEEAIALLAQEPIEVVITDYAMPGKNGLDVLRAAKSINSDCEVIIITGYGTIESAVEAMRLGAHDYITKPLKLGEIENKVDKIIRKLETRHPSHAQTWIHPSVRHFVGASAQTKQLLKMITRIAPSTTSVLITGPSGVGKELVARAIHEASPRRDRPFVAVNCAALASSVLESELFGHERGAFTGATERRAGRFERAHTGTIFLDEVGEISPGIQTKLLRVLQEGEIERVGGSDTIKVDVRVVAATNRDLFEAMQAGEFREDFYYRLNVISLRVPPLQERRDDIPALVDHFLRKYSLELHKEVYEVDDDVIGTFLNYPWPGNVRELENVIERAIVLADGERITRDDLPPEVLARQQPPSAPIPPVSADQDTLTDRTDRLESELIQRALEKFRWNKTKAADHLGLKRTTLQYKIKKYGLE
ncbi:MAG: sigma-54-dependent Fis family transcriptional regulator [Candidatus Hydrogenedentes bacterium]|nr:sigma-54-dependent Fis family transcriptional regulator [Candidatus Hydrogenedentota bacterium]